MLEFTDEELRAYADECLPEGRSAQIESQLRGSKPLQDRLAGLLADSDQGGKSVGEVWRRGRVSCPSRTVWASYLDGGIGAGLRQYLQFHLDVVGCRFCAANLDDLKSSEDAAAAVRRQKIFQTSVGRLELAKEARG